MILAIVVLCNTSRADTARGALPHSVTSGACVFVFSL